MLSLNITPSNTSYSVKSNDGLSVDHSKLRSLMRRGQSNSRRIRAVWELSPLSYQYMRAFFRTGLKEGSEPFIGKFIFEDDVVTLHKAQFIPGTFKTTKVTNYSFVIEADLNVERTKL